MAVSEKYVVRIATQAGDAVIESPEQWEALKELAEYIGLLDSGRVSGTDKVRLSAVLKCGCGTCRAGLRRDGFLVDNQA